MTDQDEAVRQFIEDRGVVRRYDLFLEWCEASGMRPVGHLAFHSALLEAARHARGPARPGGGAGQVLAGKTGSELRWGFMEGMDIGSEGDPYLDRLRIIQTPLGSVYLHHIHRPDNDRDPHDHPWSFASLVIAGGYTELSWPDKRRAGQVSTREHRRWSLHRMGRQAAHVITGIDGPLWTLVITGPRRGEWGFWHLGGFTPWREHTGEQVPQ